MTGDGGRPVEAARVIVDGSGEVRSDKDGRFVVRSVASGTRQIEALALGMSPLTSTVDVIGGDTTRVTIELHRVQTLDSVRVIAPRSIRQQRVADIDERRKLGLGYFRDSMDIGKHATLGSVFNEFPSVHTTKGGTGVGIPPVTLAGGCLANVWLDGVRSNFLLLSDLAPQDVAAIEVYPRQLTTPSEFVVRAGPSAACGAIAVWTKRALP